MTTEKLTDIGSLVDVIRDRSSLQLVHRLVVAERTFHEARMVQLKELEGALEQQLKTMK